MEEEDKIKLVDRRQKQKDSSKKITTIDYTQNTQMVMSAILALNENREC
jgi:hypothetical protein